VPYTKVTAATFEQDLTSRKYSTPSAAKIALGKCKELSESAKTKCAQSIAAHFNNLATPSSAPAKKRTAVKHSGPRKLPAVRDTGVKAREIKQGVVEDAERNKVVHTKPLKISKKAAVEKGTKSFGVTRQELSSLGLAKERVGTLTQALAAMQLAKAVNPQLDTILGTQTVQDALTGIVTELRAPQVDQVVARKFLACRDILLKDSTPVAAQPCGSEVVLPLDNSQEAAD
jgi:hypothetical protein